VPLLGGALPPHFLQLPPTAAARCDRGLLLLSAYACCLHLPWLIALPACSPRGARG
jgi:hypothetical protein